MVWQKILRNIRSQDGLGFCPVPGTVPGAWTLTAGGGDHNWCLPHPVTRDNRCRELEDNPARRTLAENMITVIPQSGRLKIVPKDIPDPNPQNL